MRHYSLKQLSKMKHISDYLYDDKNFTPARLITDLGLYEGVLIDTTNISWESTRSYVPYPGQDYITINKVCVSKDVQALHSCTGKCYHMTSFVISAWHWVYIPQELDADRFCISDAFLKVSL